MTEFPTPHADAVPQDARAALIEARGTPTLLVVVQAHRETLLYRRALLLDLEPVYQRALDKAREDHARWPDELAAKDTEIREVDALLATMGDTQP